MTWNFTLAFLAQTTSRFSCQNMGWFDKLLLNAILMTNLDISRLELDKIPISWDIHQPYSFLPFLASTFSNQESNNNLIKTSPIFRFTERFVKNYYKYDRIFYHLYSCTAPGISADDHPQGVCCQTFVPWDQAAEDRVKIAPPPPLRSLPPPLHRSIPSQTCHASKHPGCFSCQFRVDNILWA